MVKETKLYELLEVSPNCNDSDLKKAYRKMSIKWHPDKNPNSVEEATKKFQEISESFSILSDPEKRKIYDQFGKEGMEQMNSGPDIDPNDIFSQFFAGNNPFGGNGPFGGSFNFGFNQNRESKKEHITKEIKVSLKSVYNEETISIKYEYKSYCRDCDGTGNVNKIVPTCDSCNGSGVQVRIQRMGPMISQQTIPCPDCKGTGKKYTKKEDICKECDGKSYHIKERSINLPLKNGLSSGNKIHLESMGHEFKDYNTDLFLTIIITDNEKFERNGDDLVTNVEIELFQSLFGFHKIISHLNGKLININSKELTKDNTYRKIKGLGMKNLSNGKTGDLILKFIIKFPDVSNYDDNEKKSLVTLLSKNCPKEIKLEKEIKNVIKNSSNRNDQSPNIPFTSFQMKNVNVTEHKHNQEEDDKPPECVQQ